MKRQKFSTKVINKMQIKLPALSINEGIARATVAGFCASLDPTAVEIADIKCAVSEAVTNCIVHAYKNTLGQIYITVSILEGRAVKVEVRDRGCGIPDIKQARTPLFTTDRADERSGMGFTVMESFCEKIQVRSKVNFGTTVILYKQFADRDT